VIIFLFLDRMKESRTKKQPEGDSEISAWVSKSRKLENKVLHNVSKLYIKKSNHFNLKHFLH